LTFSGKSTTDQFIPGGKVEEREKGKDKTIRISVNYPKFCYCLIRSMAMALFS
jgi:hypothetical protein